jgi:hypothetical protein
MSGGDEREVGAMGVTISLPEAETRLAEAQREAQALAERIEALNMVAEGLRRLNGHAVELFPPTHTVATLPQGSGSENINSHPVGREAVRLIVAERPGLWPLRDLAQEAVDRGWAKNRKSVEVAVHRLCNDGEARRVGKGLYEFPAPAIQEGDHP